MTSKLTNDMTEECKNVLRQVKTEPEEDLAKPNLNQFKFEKKPHITIKYEKDSPTKSETKEKVLWEPPHWRQFLENLKTMRAGLNAPVDSMGCHMSMDPDAEPKVMRYQSLISLMLSSQTKDQVTFAAMGRLRARGLTVDNVLAMSDDELGKLIYPVGFWKTKVKYIKKTTQTLKEQYNGDIPDSVPKLCKLTGVGPKMAHICMSVAWNKVTGIGVDTHVHRISNRIGWVKKPTPTPEDTRKALESWLPVELWGEVNHLLVGFGQMICQPISPLCNECLNKDICPSSGKGRKTPNKKSPMKFEKDAMDAKQEITKDFKVEKLEVISKDDDDRSIEQEKKKNCPIKLRNDDIDLKNNSSKKSQVKDAINVKIKIDKVVTEEKNDVDDFEEKRDFNIKPKIQNQKRENDKRAVMKNTRNKSKNVTNSLETNCVVKSEKSPIKRKSPRIKENLSDESKKKKGLR